jgi:predicted GNAT family N-acyltransferase
MSKHEILALIHKIANYGKENLILPTAMKYILKSPTTEKEFNDYYQLRFEILRAPWGQEKGSEKDELENQSFHAMIIDEEQSILAAGRLHYNNNKEAQVRYMCVKEEFQNLGLGKMILQTLEEKALSDQKKTIVLNARETISDFYLKNGYKKIANAPTLFGTIKHIKMKKNI